MKTVYYVGMHVPKKLQAVLWSVDVKRLDIDRDKNYIIHQILSYGRLEDILWLFDNYAREDLRRVFTTIPYKDYSPSRFHFVKEYLLGLKHHSLDERLYVKNIPRRLD